MLGILDLDGAAEAVRELCAAHGVDPAMLSRLIGAERSRAGMMRRRGLFEEIDDILAASIGRQV